MTDNNEEKTESDEKSELGTADTADQTSDDMAKPDASDAQVEPKTDAENIVDKEKTADTEVEIEAEDQWKIPKEELCKIVEGLLFVSGRVITLSQLNKAVKDASKKELNIVTDELLERFANDSQGFHLVEVNNGFQFRSDAICASYIKEMLKARPTRLSKAALETLAIIAYRQPVTRADIEEIRAVDAGGVVRTLLEKRLIKILGKREEPGRPLIYGTSKMFLETFNMRTLKDLPTLQEFQELSTEHEDMVESTFSRDEIALAEEEQDNLYAVSEVDADDSDGAVDLQNAADALDMAVQAADDTITEVMGRKPYDEQEEGDMDDEGLADVEIIGELKQDDKTAKKAQKDNLVLTEGPDVDPDPEIFNETKFDETDETDIDESQVDVNTKEEE